MISFLNEKREEEIPVQQKDCRLEKNDFENESLGREGSSDESSDHHSYSPTQVICTWKRKSRRNQFLSYPTRSVNSSLDSSHSLTTT